jgi:NAD(P)-dependent dehydrogenase (short-subunit alcohol dehydrogenase family)
MFRPYSDELSEKIVLVTGGSQGIGAAVVARLAAAGAKVATSARSKRPSGDLGFRPGRRSARLAFARLRSGN